MLLVLSLFIFPMIGATPSHAASSDKTAEYKYQIYSQTNAQRKANGKGSLAASPHLNKIAQDWANHLAKTSEWRHNPNVFAQVRSVGTWTLVGENLSAGYANGNDAVDGWMKSPGHRSNILNSYNRIGIGVAFGGQYGVYYVQVFGNVTSSAGSQTANLYPKPVNWSNPKGHMDKVTVNSDGTISFSGWGFDADAPSSSTQVHIYIDGKGHSVAANGSRADVKKVYKLGTDKVGFKWTSSKMSKGNHSIKVAVINKGGGSNVWFWSGTKKVTGNDPQAHMDKVAVNSDGTVTVSGWAFDADSPNSSTRVHIYIDGKGYSINADASRADVKKAYSSKIKTDKVGFKWTSPKLSKGKHSIKAAAINKGVGANKWFWSGEKSTK